VASAAWPPPRALTPPPRAPCSDYDKFSVIRRFNDFCWLRDQLEAQYPGVIVPPLPEKLVVGRFSDEFVETRRRGLERFLVGVSQHALLKESQALRVFLEASEEAFARQRGGASAVGFAEHHAGVSATGFWEWAQEASSSLGEKLSGAPARASLRERTPEDERFDEARRYVDGFEPHVQSVSKRAAELVGRDREVANGLFEFGLAFSLLGQSEHGALGPAMSHLGHCVDRLSVLASEEADKEQVLFVEPVRNYVRLVASVKRALDARTARQRAYEAALAEVMGKRSARARLASQPSAATGTHDRLAAADQEVVRAEAKAEGAKEEFDLVTRRVLVEIERFKREKLLDFKAMILEFVQLQIEHHQRVEEAWRSVLPELQAIGASQRGGGSSNGPNLGSDAGADV
jgi:sorting nexin-1/2